VEVLGMTVQKITPKELHEKLRHNEKITLIDVRAEDKYRDFHIEDPMIEGQNIPKTEIFDLEESGGELAIPKEKEIIMTCTTGNSAAKCANILDAKGHKVVLLEGGLTAWKEYMNSLGK
jgi:rhodanese-related sulfurtransferase